MPLLLMYMKIYLKAVFPIFITAFVYAVLTVFFGPKGLQAEKFMKNQRDSLVTHVNALNKINNELDDIIRNLTYDSNTIAIYANELGYINANEGIIKLVNFTPNSGNKLHPGTSLEIQQPKFLSDYFCKTIACSAGLIILLFEIFIVYKNGYSKKQ